MTELTLYTTEPCPYCASAKTLLARRGVDYTEINLARDLEGRAELAQRTGLMTFPQIVIDGETLGGFEELQAADRSGELARRLGAEPG
jgi:glutaredoxin 3